MSLSRQVGYSGSGQRYLLSIDGDAPIPLENVSITENGHLGGGLIQPPRETLVEVTTQSGVGLGVLFHDELNQLRTQIAELRSWLSGVLAVEDPDLPGRFYCGVCHKNLQAHADGCPAAGV